MTKEQEKQNSKQNISIAELQIKVQNLEDRFETFCSNEFVHLRDQVEQINKNIIWGVLMILALQVVLKFIQ
jgi:hypothetical protein